MKNPLIVSAAGGLLAASGAGAAIALHTITLKPGACVKPLKTVRVCAAKVALEAPFTTTVTSTVTITTTPQPQVSFNDGTYRVGVDVQPGTYEIQNAPSGCYWERLSGFGGTLGEIIANDFTTGGNVIVTIASSDVGFHSSDCGSWAKIG